MESIKKEIPKENNDINLLKIIDEVYASKIKNNDFSDILEFTNSFKINREEIQNEYKNKNINDFIEIFNNEDGSHTIDKISNFISYKGLPEFLYLFLILKTKENAPHKKIVDCLTHALSFRLENEQAQSIQKSLAKPLKPDELKVIKDQVGKTNRFIQDFKIEIYNKINDIDERINNIFLKLQKILSAINLENDKDESQTLAGNSNPDVSGKSRNVKPEILQLAAQNVKKIGLFSYLKNNISLFLQIITFIFIAIISFFLIFTDFLKSSVSETKFDSSKLVSDLNTNLNTKIIASLKPVTDSITSLGNKINDFGSKGTQFKQIDEDGINNIKKEVETVINELFKNKKLSVDTTKFDTLINLIEGLNLVAIPKEEDKRKGEDKKAKDNQPKGIPPSHKVTAEDKKDIAKITSDLIKSIIEEEIKKISLNNEKSKIKGNELAIKEKELTELLVNQEKLKIDLETQKRLVLSKDKELQDVNKSKISFKGTPGSYAILLTNSKDFELTEPILSATLVSVEKQIKESNGVQKLGIYAATGNAIDVKFNLKKGTRGLKPTEMDIANARPTETIAEVGKTFLEFAFDDGKDPVIPINDRKAIIIATWAAGAPKDNDGWDKISQVDAILIQTPKANQLREGSAWLDFILKKNGRLLFVQAEEKITGSSPAIVQLQKHLSTLLSTKKD